MKKSWKKKAISIAMLLLIICVLSGMCYIKDYYHSENIVQQYVQMEGTVKIEEIEEGLFLDGMGNRDALIFYPGAKVEYTSYIPLFYHLADQGMDVFLLHMPCNFAFFGKNKADDIINAYEYENWYIGGHSLGGAMSASYAADHLDILRGVVLMSAYPTDSLKEEEFSVLSIYGSEDKVLNMEKVKEGREYMPSDYTEICIDGGNHAQFGNYGIQGGDGKALIPAEEQQELQISVDLHADSVCNCMPISERSAQHSALTA